MIIRDLFFGLALWGVVTLMLPTAALYWVYMGLGVLTSVGLCTVLMIIFFDWLRVRYGDET